MKNDKTITKTYNDKINPAVRLDTMKSETRMIMNTALALSLEIFFFSEFSPIYGYN
jgi:hypothetical protein